MSSEPLLPAAGISSLGDAAHTHRCTQLASNVPSPRWGCSFADCVTYEVYHLRTPSVFERRCLWPFALCTALPAPWWGVTSTTTMATLRWLFSLTVQASHPGE